MNFDHHPNMKKKEYLNCKELFEKYTQADAHLLIENGLKFQKFVIDEIETFYKPK